MLFDMTVVEASNCRYYNTYGSLSAYRAYTLYACAVQAWCGEAQGGHAAIRPGPLS